MEDPPQGPPPAAANAEPAKADSSINLLLGWSEGERKHEEGDMFVALTEAVDEEHHVEADAEEREVDWSVGTDFQWSEERAHAIDQALLRLGQHPSSRVCGLLKDLLENRHAPDFEQRLGSVEAWLLAQLPHWQKPVRARPPGEDPAVDPSEEAELVSSFNDSLSSASGGISLALEVVGILRSGESHQLPLAEALVRQVNDLFVTARKELLAAEPPPPP